MSPSPHPTTAPDCPVCGHPLVTQPCSRCGGTAFHPGSVQPIEPGKRLFLTDLFDGFFSYWRAGIHMFTRPEYAGKLWLPITANVVAVGLLGVLVWFGVDWTYSLMGIESWAESCFIGDALLKAMVFLILTWFIGSSLTELVTSPFLDGLAETAEVTVGGKAMAGNPIGFMKSVAVGTKQALQLLLMQILLFPIGLILATFVPVFGWLLAMGLASFVTAVVWFEFPFLRRDQPFKHRVRVLRHNWALAMGFGIGFQVGITVPIFNLLFLTPAAAIAASELYFRMEKRVG